MSFLILLPACINVYTILNHNLRQQAIDQQAPLYECPSMEGGLPKAQNDVPGFFSYYTSQIDDHEEEGLNDFKDRTYGGRGQTFYEMRS